MFDPTPVNAVFHPGHTCQKCGFLKGGGCSCPTMPITPVNAPAEPVEPATPITVERLAAELAVARNGGGDIEARVSSILEIIMKAPETCQTELRVARRALDLLRPEGAKPWHELQSAVNKASGGERSSADPEALTRAWESIATLRTALQIQQAALAEIARLQGLIDDFSRTNTDWLAACDEEDKAEEAGLLTAGLMDSAQSAWDALSVAEDAILAAATPKEPPCPPSTP